MTFTIPSIKRPTFKADCGCTISEDWDEALAVAASTRSFTPCEEHAALPDIKTREEMCAMFLKGKIEDERVAHKPSLVPERKYEAPNVVRENTGRPNVGLVRGTHRPGPKVGSGGGAGIRLVNPIKNLSSAAAGHIAALKSPNKAPLTVDMDEVPEDVRVTNLLESVMPLVDDTAGVGPAGGDEDDMDDVEL